MTDARQTVDDVVDAVAIPEEATVDAARAAEIRGRRQWPLPKLAVPGAPLLEVKDLKTHFKLPQGWVTDTSKDLQPAPGRAAYLCPDHAGLSTRQRRP